MNISLLQNGLHSLNKGYLLIKQLEICKSKDEEYFLIKDAILSIHHGIEILMKECLRKKNEFLIFSNIDKAVKDTYKEKRQKKLENIFMTTKIKDVHMVTYEEAIDRMDAFYDVELKKELKESLIKLNKYRNIITHSGIYLEPVEVLDTIYSLAHSLDFYFEEILKDEYDISTGYINLKNAINSLDEYSGNLKLYKCIVDILKKEEINLGLGEVVYISDINKAYNFLNNFFKSGFILGSDLLNGFCSGKITEIKRTKTNILIYTDDNESIYNFKFNEMLVAIPPSLESKESPLIYIESSINEEDKFDEKYKIKTKYKGVEYVEELYIPSEDKKLYGQDIFDNIERLQTNGIKHITTFYFLNKKVLVFLNVQTFKFDFGQYLLYKIKDHNISELKPTILDYYSI
ncbi:hypothetical protein [Cetobacterium sp.]|uniref:hypothetical protein n=1 Tax=Cetobacterium sp. TaxID=2071632 RepID=UPI003F392020